MREVYPGIFMITEQGFKGIKPPVNMYVITGNNGLIFDAGYGLSSDVKFFLKEYNAIESICKSRNTPFSISRILPSHMHGDHFSGLNKIKAALGVSILLTRNMAEIVPSWKTYRNSFKDVRPLSHESESTWPQQLLGRVSKRISDFVFLKVFGVDFVEKPDFFIEESSTIAINNEEWEIFPSPGHAREHISLYDPRKGILFAGDNVIRSITPWLGPPRSDINEYISSLEHMLTLPKLEVILSAHGSPVVNPKDRIREIISWRNERTEHVMFIIRKYAEHGVGFKQIVDELYPGFGLKKKLAQGWVQLTIEYLEEAGRIEIQRPDGKVLFFACE
ncbi:MAG: MBL fold metallo-hydrolase [bacterium]|nr:MBL fold metallo-hydrolase [bacterium]